MDIQQRGQPERSCHPSEAHLMANQFVAVTDFTLVEKGPVPKTHSCKAGQVCSLAKGSPLADTALERGLIIEQTTPSKALGKKKALESSKGLGDKNGNIRK